jgi:hypothetical protein
MRSEERAVEFAAPYIPTGERVIARTFAAVLWGRMAGSVFVSVTDESFVVCRQRRDKLLRWEHVMTVPLAQVHATKFRRGLLNTILVLDVGGVAIRLLLGNLIPRASKYADLAALRDALT